MSQYPHRFTPALLKMRNSEQLVPQMASEGASITAFDEPDSTSQTMSFEEATRVVEKHRKEAQGYCWGAVEYLEALSLQEGLNLQEAMRVYNMRRREAVGVFERRRKEALDRREALGDLEKQRQEALDEAARDIESRRKEALEHAVGVVKRRRKEFVKQREAGRVRERHHKEARDHLETLKALRPCQTTTSGPPPSAPADVGSALVALLCKAPTSYPYLETPLNVFLPLHFTHTSVKPIDDEGGHVWYDAIQKIFPELENICDSFGPSMVCSVVYGHVEMKHSPYPGSEEIAWRPRVLAFYLEPQDLHRWRELESKVQKVLKRTFGTAGPPVRYYYGHDFGDVF